ncbi:MAG: TlpA family protein disulfide reductase [Acidimicrobiia bacterium]
MRETDGLGGAASETATAQPARRRRRRWLWAAAIAAALGGIGASAAYYSGPRTSGSTVERREPAPQFVLPNLSTGQPDVDLAALAGGPVVLNFWASWCVPCRREMPAFEQVHEEFGEAVTFLGVNHQDTRDAAIALLAETGITYSSGFDPAGDVAFDFGLYGMPTTVFIDRNGMIVAQHTGELTRGDLRQSIRELFGV